MASLVRLTFWGTFLMAISLSVSGQNAAQVRRGEILSRAQEYVELKWTPTSQNVGAQCIAGYRSDYAANVGQIGEAYRWGGSDNPSDFITKLRQGLGAGTHARHHENLQMPCTTGVDCSGFVCNLWKHAHVATNAFRTISTPLADLSDMKVGDAFLKQGTHVVLFVGFGADGNPLIYEAAGKRVQEVKGVDWSYVQDYVPVRYTGIID